MTREERELAIYCLKASSDFHEEVCEECKKYPNCDHFAQDNLTETIIEALSAEPCPYYDTEVKTCRRSEVPSEDAISREVGEWLSAIVKEKGWDGKERQYYQPISCSVCHKPNHVKSNYCPNCGAKMDKGE